VPALVQRPLRPSTPLPAGSSGHPRAPTIVDVGIRIPQSLLRLSPDPGIRARVGAVALVIVAVGGSYYNARHPSREDVARHITRDALLGRQPDLSDAEIRVLNERPDVPARQWVTEQLPSNTRVHHLDRPGELRLRVGYSDGYMDVYDVRHLVTDHDADPIDVVAKTDSVAAGGPGAAMIATCCEGNDARVTLALLRAAPARATGDWPEVTELDLDLATGRLAFSSTGGISDVVNAPAGRYRMRVSGRGAAEFEYDRERFLLELWPREKDRPMAVLRTAPQR